jgi:GNAT superfamily N-acetyltransferase
MRFRRALERDAPALSEIAFRSKSSWRYSAAQLDAWRDDLTVSAGTIAAQPTCVVEVDGEVLGFFALWPQPGFWRLEHFWLLPAGMGRGIGRAMLGCAVGIAAHGGATAVEVDADPNAEPFYVACGARKVGSIAAPIEGAPGRQRPQLRLATARPAPPDRPGGVRPSSFESFGPGFQGSPCPSSIS